MPTIEENLGRIADAAERSATALEALAKAGGFPASTGKPDAFAEAVDKVPAEKQKPAAGKSATKPKATAAPKAEPEPDPEPEVEEDEEEVVDEEEKAEPITHETVRSWQRDARERYAKDAGKTASLKAAYPDLIRKHGGEGDDGKATLPLVPEAKLPSLLAALKKVVGE